MKAGKGNGKERLAVIEVDKQELRFHVFEIFRQNVEETLNRQLDAGTDDLCQVGCCKRSIRVVP